MAQETKTKRKPGRPPLTEPRQRKLTVRLKDRESRLLDIMAMQRGLSATALAQRLVEAQLQGLDKGKE